MNVNKSVLRASMFAIAVAGLPLHAQEKSPYEGTWEFEMTSAAGRCCAYAALTFSSGGGLWKSMSKTIGGEGLGKANPCLVNDPPIEDVQATADSLKFKIFRSKLLHGCPDYQLDFKLVDGKLKGDVTSLGGAIAGTAVGVRK